MKPAIRGADRGQIRASVCAPGFAGIRAGGGCRRESGFALLLVFLMAATIAITLYMEIPRIAFETQRQKEELLIERGEQYKRAIKVFVSPQRRGALAFEDRGSGKLQ